MKLKVSALSVKGNYRELNEDAYYLPKKNEFYCCVADGMGGHNAGEVASAMAVKTFSSEMAKKELDVSDRMFHAVECANETIFAEALADTAKAGMGTTLTAIALDAGRLYIAHVGDSRLYLLRRESILQLTTDHSLVEEMVSRGMISRDEAREHPQRNVITRALGTTPTAKVDLLTLRVKPGDVFLLCSDGLSGAVDEDELEKVLLSDYTDKTKAKRLIAAAEKNGSTDNITAMIARVEDDGK